MGDPGVAPFGLLMVHGRGEWDVPGSSSSILVEVPDTDSDAEFEFWIM